MIIIGAFFKDIAMRWSFLNKEDAYMNRCLVHYGIRGQRWGERRFQNADGSLTPEGRIRYAGETAKRQETLFVSGSSKTQDKTSGYYRRKLPKEIRKELRSSMKQKDKIVVGDAPGIDRQVQDYLKKRRYKDVEIYGPGKKVRYIANEKWKTHPIDDPKHEPFSSEWLAKKDRVMTKVADKGLAVILDEGATATRNNVKRLIDQNKQVKVYSLNRYEKDKWIG